MALRILKSSVVVVAGLLFSCISADAATMTMNVSAPAVNDADIAQLVSGTQVTAPDSADAIYLYSDRPAQGQSFTTGSNPNGYILDAVTIQHFGAGGGVYPGGLSLPLRISQIAGSVITVLHSETTPEVPFLNPAGNDYMTFTLAAPQLLAPNTTYGFDAGMLSGGFAILSNNADPYAGGNAYSSGDNGIGTLLADFRDGDRVFHINLTAVPPAPEPSSLLLLAMGVLALRGRRKNCA